MIRHTNKQTEITTIYMIGHTNKQTEITTVYMIGHTNKQTEITTIYAQKFNEKNLIFGNFSSDLVVFDEIN